ncbi:hypothetical protein REPUB_Repub13aG0116500 [Reevesia pubescens]
MQIPTRPVVIDVRNNYETRIGIFKGAVDPCTTAFYEFPSWVENQFQPDGAEVEHEKVEKIGLNERNNKDAEIPTRPIWSMKRWRRKDCMKETIKMQRLQNKKCQSGLQCIAQEVFDVRKLQVFSSSKVYHLKGGILKYLEEVPKTESLWDGECFVFNKRVSVEHGLVQGNFKLCYGCKQPFSDADMEAPEWEYGVSCPYCHSLKSEEEKERARTRQRQFEAWGIIGGPDKGLRPDVKTGSIKSTQSNLSASV